MKNFAELDSKICSCTDALTAKLDGTNGKRAILLCGGTGCLSSNSMDIKGKFDQLVAANNLHRQAPKRKGQPASSPQSAAPWFRSLRSRSARQFSML